MELLNSTLYSAVFKRKSTRSYSNEVISGEITEKLRAFVSELVPLFPSERAALDIQPYKGNAMKIAAYAESDTAAFINLAFMLQQADLFLQANGLGALWNATIRATEKQKQGLPYGISLIFGVAKENSVRTDISQFDRKGSEEISNQPKMPWVEAVRLAPSARNRQPWYLACEQGCVDFYCKEGNFFDKTILKNLHWFDIGIAVCHAVIALQMDGLSPVAVIKSEVSEKKGYIYGISLEY